MTEHLPSPRTYTEPTWGGMSWVIVERNEEGEVTAEYGYPTESAAWDAYRAVTS